MRARPLGVTIFAVLYFLSVATYTVLCVLSLTARSVIHTLLERLSPAGNGPVILLRLGGLLAFYFLAMAVVTGLLGLGMWRLKNWARVITMILAGVSVVVVVVRMVGTLQQMQTAGVVLTLVRVGLCLLVLWYLGWSSSARAAFAATPAETERSTP
jgi:hypothetical protein